MIKFFTDYIEKRKNKKLIIKSEIERIKEITPFIFIDFHAEATAEKICMGKFVSELGCTAFVGTHTHVQTADEKIINSTAYITDVGFCGDDDGVIGMDYSTSLKRFLDCLPERYEVATGGKIRINAVEISAIDGKATDIKRFNFLVDNDKEMEASCENNDNES